MHRTRKSDSTPTRWGLTATWLLGVTAVLGTLIATVDRVVEARAGSSPAPPAGPRLLLPPPDTPRPVHRAGARRVDTFPEMLSATHAVEIEEGWVVLDARARRLHVVPDRAGLPLRSFGREGEGPGELGLPFRVAVSVGRIGVLEARGDRLVRFRLDGTALGAVSLRHGSCGFGPPRALLAAPGGGFLALRTCSGLDGASRALLLGIDPGGRVRVAADRPLQSLRSGPVDPFATPVAAIWEGEAYLGLLSEGCLARVEPEDRPASPTSPASICAPEGARAPLPDALRTRLEALARRMAQVGGSLEMPDELPVFMDVRTTSSGLVLEVPLPDGRDALDLVRHGGGRERYDVGETGTAFVGVRHILLARDLAAGTELAWVERGG